MKVDIIASEAHYLDHMLPIFDALPERLKGFVHPVRSEIHRPTFNNLALVAGYRDIDALRGRASMVYVEHGAGQAYLGDENTKADPSYSGGGDRHGNSVLGYICPSAEVAARWSKPAIAVGCPKMDRWTAARSIAWASSVCIAFHWNCTLCPEARSALSHYALHLPQIVQSFKAQGFDVYGHAHPRWGRQLDTLFEASGMTVLRSDVDVFSTADILVMDNSSLMYEFAALDRPVVALNAPWYRRDVEHGLRFWSDVPGPQVDEPDQLADLDLFSLVHVDEWAQRRRAVVDRTYAFNDGSSSERAAAWVAQLVDGL